MRALLGVLCIAALGQIGSCLNPLESAVAGFINRVANEGQFKSNPLREVNTQPFKPIGEDVNFHCYNRTTKKIFIMNPTNHTFNKVKKLELHFMIHGWTDSINATDWVPAMFEGTLIGILILKPTVLNLTSRLNCYLFTKWARTPWLLENSM